MSAASRVGNICAPRVAMIPSAKAGRESSASMSVEPPHLDRIFGDFDSFVEVGLEEGALVEMGFGLGEAVRLDQHQQARTRLVLTAEEAREPGPAERLGQMLVDLVGGRQPLPDARLQEPDQNEQHRRLLRSWPADRPTRPRARGMASTAGAPARSDQEDVAGMDDMHRAVRQAEAEGAALVEAVEQALDRLALAAADRKRGARRGGDGEPLAAEDLETLGPPAAQA